MGTEQSEGGAQRERDLEQERRRVAAGPGDRWSPRMLTVKRRPAATFMRRVVPHCVGVASGCVWAEDPGEAQPEGDREDEHKEGCGPAATRSRWLETMSHS